MKIGIVSDSHGDIRVFEDMLAVPGAAAVELWLHAGERVLGNCDVYADGIYEETVVEAAGHRIFLTHGHLFNVRFDTAMLSAAAREAGADIAVYGHTHTALEERGDVTVLNPGSIARPRDERRGSFMLVELHEHEVPQVELLRIR